MDMEACNFDPTATIDDGTNCDYPDEGFDCNGDCLDTNMNMVCDAEETGCMDITACNYDALAAFDDNDQCTSRTRRGLLNCDDADGDGASTTPTWMAFVMQLDDDESCVFADDTCEECADDGSVVLNDIDDGVPTTKSTMEAASCTYHQEANT